MPRQGSIAGASLNVNHVPADVTGQTFSRPEGTFSRSYIASAPYPGSIGAFPDSGFVPGALPQRVPGNSPKWITRDGFYWMPTSGRNIAGASTWGPFENGYHFFGRGNYPYGGYGYYPYGWGGDGTFVMAGDSALRAWAGEPVDGYPPQGYNGLSLPTSSHELSSFTHGAESVPAAPKRLPTG